MTPSARINEPNRWTDWCLPIPDDGLRLFMEELDKRLHERGFPVNVNALHPGPVNSSITRHFMGAYICTWGLSMWDVVCKSCRTHRPDLRLYGRRLRALGVAEVARRQAFPPRSS